MSHHTNTLRDIRHLTGQIFWSVFAVFLLLVTMHWGTSFGSLVGGLRLLLGSIVLLYLPGYRITKAAWYGEPLDHLELTVLSFAFSLSVVPLLVFYIHLLGVAITQGMVLLVIIGILIMAIGRCVRRK